MAGLKVVPVKALADGSLDLVDLRMKAEKHKDNLSSFMVRYEFLLYLFGKRTGRSHIPPRLASLKMVLQR